MKKLKTYWKQASRPTKIFLTVLLLLIAGMGTYIALGSPPLTPRMGFHQGEKANMIGPSQILGEFTLNPPQRLAIAQPHPYKEKVIIAQTDSFDILYNYHHNTFYSYPRSDEPGLYSVSASIPEYEAARGEITVPLQLILFDRNEQAARAEIEFRVTESRTEAFINGTIFKVSAQRQYDGFFYFSIIPTSYYQQKDLQAFHTFCTSYAAEGKPEITLRLYDENDNLLSTEIILPGLTIGQQAKNST